MIEGLTQGIEYGADSNLIYARARYQSADATPDNDPTITIYDPDGTEVQAEASMTQVGTTAVYYYDLDASSTSTFPLGYYYKALIYFEVSSVPVKDYLMLDVVRWPFNEPLVATEEIDDLHPTWAGKRPAGWTDWTLAIEQAHLELAKDLREMRDSKGDPIYPNRLLDRGQVRMTEIAYIERVIANEIRMSDAQREYILNKVPYSIPTLLRVDSDDDLLTTDEEERTAGVPLVR